MQECNFWMACGHMGEYIYVSDVDSDVSVIGDIMKVSNTETKTKFSLREDHQSPTSCGGGL